MSIPIKYIAVAFCIYFMFLILRCFWGIIGLYLPQEHSSGVDGGNGLGKSLALWVFIVFSIIAVIFAVWNYRIYLNPQNTFSIKMQLGFIFITICATFFVLSEYVFR